MDRAEGALLVAEKALEAVRQLAGVVDTLRAELGRVPECVGQEVTKAVTAIPVPKDGKPGDSIKGDKGDKGEDGKSITLDEVAPVVEGAFAGWALDFERRSHDILKTIADRIPTPKDEEQVVKSVMDRVSELISAIPAPRDGTNGVDGKDGLNGKDGTNGKDGVDGRNGLSAYELAASKGFVGSELDWLTSLVGKSGADGINGKDGIGRDGIDGRDGQEGAAGRDAIHIDVLDGIDSTRRYQRGTFAAYRGGMIRAFRQTDPIGDGALEKSGWHVVMRGIDETAVDLGSDGRTLGMALRFTDGLTITKTLSIPTAIYRGIWKEGDSYTRGDSTTRDGSTWTLMETEQKGQPGEEGSGWVLSVKRGRDGRNGLKGDAGARGAEGRAGRDLTQINHADGSKW